MTLQQVTAEFAGHFRILRDKAGGLPFAVSKLPAGDSHLRASIRELYLDWTVLQELQAWGRQRDWPEILPTFSKAYDEFSERWKDPFFALLRQKYEEIFSDEPLLEWFVRLACQCSKLEALQQHPYDTAIRRIERITRDLQRPELADLFCDDPELLERMPGLGGFTINFDALREMEEEAIRKAQAATRRRVEEAAKPEYEKAITRLRASMWDPNLARDGDDQGWFFDPDRHSAAELINELADHCRARGGEHPLWQRWEGAFSWLRDTVDLDLVEIERRWRRITPILVSPTASEGQGPDDPESLFGYLNQVRRAYMIGADLAALAMCRSVTEMLFRRYYNSDEDTKLGLLIQRTQRNQRYAFMRRLNIADKLNIAKAVEEANRILHSRAEDIQNRRRTQELVEGWTRALAELIRQAPPATRR